MGKGILPAYLTTVRVSAFYPHKKIPFKAEDGLHWFCAVTRNGGVLVKTLDLTVAQQALGFGDSGHRQAIIPMIDSKAGDPHDLDKSWATGSMWWWNWPDINVMQADCERAGLSNVTGLAHFLTQKLESMFTSFLLLHRGQN